MDKMVNKNCNSPCPCSQVKGSVSSRQWDVRSIYQDPSSSNCYAVVILNREISQTQEFIFPLWNNATLRVTVDGGTVRWDKYLKCLSKQNQEKIKEPNFITGDFDSITQEILEKYKKKGCKLINTPDQSHTDFTKSLMEIKIYCQENNIQLDCVVAICQSSGRLDQTLANIQTLHLVKENNILGDDTKVYLISDNSIAWLLYPGHHVIDIPRDILTQRNPWCSLLPVGQACERVTTSGLKWNLDNNMLSFGGIVSSSNTYDGGDQVKVDCSHPLLWAMKVPIKLLDPLPTTSENTNDKTMYMLELKTE